MYLGNMINISWVIWAARELLCMHTFQLLSTVSDELVAVDSHDESCDHCLFSRHPLHMITQSKHKWLFCMINIIFFLSLGMKLHDIWKERDHSASRWWINVFSCVLKRVHHDGTAVPSGKGVKTVERNYRCWKSACELAVKYVFKTSELLPRSPSSWPLPRILLKITVWDIRFVSSAELKFSVQQEDPVIEGRRWTLESALPVGLHWTMGLSDPICWSEHPSAVFQKKLLFLPALCSFEWTVHFQGPRTSVSCSLGYNERSCVCCEQGSSLSSFLCVL